jgi:3-methyladenine DNA glycosylase AlkD
MSLGDMEKFAALFTSQQINDWNICDWFCIKFLSKLISKYPEDISKVLESWSQSTFLWQARASVVGYVAILKNGDSALMHHAIRNCTVLVKSDERFAQTAVGWVVRECGKVSANRRDEFLTNHLAFLSKEGLSYGLEKVSDQDRKAWFKKWEQAKKRTVATGRTQEEVGTAAGKTRKRRRTK